MEIFFFLFLTEIIVNFDYKLFKLDVDINSWSRKKIKYDFNVVFT